MIVSGPGENIYMFCRSCCGEEETDNSNSFAHFVQLLLRPNLAINMTITPPHLTIELELVWPVSALLEEAFVQFSILAPTAA